MFFFESILEEIENDITGNIDVCKLAKKANMSLYEFRRIFTFVTKISLAEYIRKRRLSLAALEIFEGNTSITEISSKYGYNSQSSFSRAFREFHGITPTDVQSGNNNFRILSKISTHITTSGGKEIPCIMKKLPGFCIRGLSAESDWSDTECCENVWSSFYNSEFKELPKAVDKIYAAYQDKGDSINCFIGTTNDIEDFPVQIEIGPSVWACFSMNTTDDCAVNEFYHNILTEWLSSVNYKKRTDLPNVEIFPSDMTEDGFLWKILIPIEKK